MITSKQKGYLLENVVEQLCLGIENAIITKNANIVGKQSLTEREIDVLIEGYVGAFKVKIAIEAKNYNKPVGVEKVESFITKLKDIGVNLGVMVCPKGFSESARKMALANAIQLFEVYDPSLGNSEIFIPLRFVIPVVKNYALKIEHRTGGPFEIPADISRWRFHIGSNLLKKEQLVAHAWNNGMFPHQAGEYTANFNAVTLSDSEDPKKIQYCELSLKLEVNEKYFLKQYPASFMRNTENQKDHINLGIDIYSRDEEMLADGWTLFETFEEMNEAAKIDIQSKEEKFFLIRSDYLIRDKTDEDV